MIRAALAALLACLAMSAQAGCITGDWRARDKTLHAVGTAAIVFGTDAAVRAFAPDAFAKMHDVGVLPGVTAAVMREADKVAFGGRCEWASMAYDAAGIAIGVTATHWLLLPDAHGVTVAYSREF